jgi:hypothetical protein
MPPPDPPPTEHPPPTGLPPPEAVKPLAGAVAADMPPITRAGVVLAKTVLCYIAGTIVLLLAILTLTEVIDAQHQYALQDDFTRQASLSPVLPDAAKLEAWRSGLNELSVNVSRAATADQQNAWRELYDRLRLNDSISQRQAGILTPCVAPSGTEPSRTQPPLPRQATLEQLAACADLLHTLETESRSAAVNTDKIKLLSDFAKEAASEHQNSRSFWLQIAQLILLNLLLPILTALLGYIFGTQQVPTPKAPA